MYSGYGYFNRTEIWNNERVVAYLKGNPLLGIPGLRQPNTIVNDCGCQTALCLYCDHGSGVEDTFLSVRDDDAPWYDPDVPESEEFAGLFVEDITGFDSVVRRDFSDGAISGGSLGPLRLGGRCMTVTGWIRGKTCCATEYGLRWLTEALMGSGSCSDCALGDLYMLKCCPGDGDTCHYVVDPNLSVQMDTTVTLTVTITDLGGGLYAFQIDDANLSGLIGDPLGVAGNIDGAFPAAQTAFAETSSWYFVNDSTGAIHPIDYIVDGNDSIGLNFPSVADIVVNTNRDPFDPCDATEHLMQNYFDQVTAWVEAYGSGVPVVVRVATQFTAAQMESGPDPQDYKRLLHRVGLTDGPKVLERHGTCCQNNCGCVNLRVQFTLCSELPYIFSDIEWCAEEEPFDLETEYCLNLRNLCRSCTNLDPTREVEREVARKPRNISLFSDQTWCPEGWDRGELGCPPEDGYLQIGTVEANVCTDGTDVAAQISLEPDGTWQEWPAGVWSADDAFPPPYGGIELYNPGNCSVPSEGLFMPNDSTTRQSMAAFLYRADGSPPFVPPGTPTFSDVETTHPFYTEIEWVNDQGILTGYGDDTFRPSDNLSRMACAAAMYRLNGSPPYVPPAAATFSDVSTTHTFYLEIEWCAAEGIMEGYSSGLFKPSISLARQAAMAVFYRNAGSPLFTGPADPTFSDVDVTNPFYLEIEWAASEGITTGFEDGDSTVEVDPCLVKVTFNASTGARSWEPIRWDGDLEAISSGESDCVCLAIAEVCVIGSTACATSDDCLIDVSCGTSYRPANYLPRQAAAAFFYRMNGSPAFTPPTTPTFTDVPAFHAFYLEIEWMVDEGITTGFSDGTFRPDVATSRAAMMTFLYRDAGSPAFVPPASPTFPDVATSHPSYLEIEWAADEGIAQGYPDGTFHPEDATTRMAAAAFIYRYNGSPAFVPPTDPTFIDVDLTHTFYLEIEWLYDEDITEGFTEQTFWSPIDWIYEPGDTFPPANCNLVIGTVNGEEPNLDPVVEVVEVPYDEFIPDCGPFPVPPPSPFLITGAECFCEPWSSTRVCCTFSNEADWSEATTYVEIQAGSAEMRHLKIEAYQNPFGVAVPCPCDPNDDFWLCRTPCSTIGVPQLPSGSKLIIDSRQRVAQLVLSSGRVVNALRYIFSGDGLPFEWFDVAQCSTLCIVVSVDVAHVAADATVSIGVAGRYVASGW